MASRYLGSFVTQQWITETKLSSVVQAQLALNAQIFQVSSSSPALSKKLLDAAELARGGSWVPWSLAMGLFS